MTLPAWVTDDPGVHRRTLQFNAPFGSVESFAITDVFINLPGQMDDVMWDRLTEALAVSVTILVDEMRSEMGSPRSAPPPAPRRRRRYQK